MKKDKITSIVIIVLGAILMLGTSTIFKTCDINEKIMKCHWAGRTEIVIGFLLFLSGILLIISKAKETKIILYIMSIAISISAILIPTVIIGGCIKADMICRTISYPCIYLISSIAIAISIIGLALQHKNKKAV